MIQPLSPEQQSWVEEQLHSLSLSQRVAQLFIPKITDDEDADKLIALMDEIPFGGLFVWGASAETHRNRLEKIQAASHIPIVVAGDLENGPGYVITGKTQFPDTLAIAAANSEDLAYTVGKAAAVHGRNVGIHWSYAPIVDVNVNPDNPIANTRGFGDDPERISRLANAMIRGMQEHELAACTKHFPGDGIDDVDQHVAASVNHLPLEEWKAISARTFASAFAQGVWSVMIGHIALPAWDGDADARGAYRPATVSPRIVTDLLRKEMGFDGLIVTDDMNMGGVAGYMNFRDLTVNCIKAGCDMLLFPLMPESQKALLGALNSGELPEERVNDAARRVLEFKARLGLHLGANVTEDPSEETERSFDEASREIEERAVHLVQDVNGILPLKDLKPGAKVLTITLTNDNLDCLTVDEELRARGFEVEHIAVPVFGQVDTYIDKVDAIFVNLTFRADWCIGSPRSVGPQNRVFMNGFYMRHPRVVFTSFGSPYHLRQFSTFPTYINAHSFSHGSQRAAVKAWFGEIPMRNDGPAGNLKRVF